MPSTVKDEAISGLRGSSAPRDRSSNETKDDLCDTANKMGHKVREFVESANDEINRATKTVTAHINDKPVQSSLIALGIGYILGSLMRR